MTMTFAGANEGVLIRCDVSAHIMCEGRGYGRGETILYEHIKTTSVVTATYRGMEIRRFIPDEFFTPDASKYEEKYEPTSRPRQSYQQRSLTADQIMDLYRQMMNK